MTCAEKKFTHKSKSKEMMNWQNNEPGNIHGSITMSRSKQASEALLYPSFSPPFVLLWSPCGESEDARYIHGGFSEPSRRCVGGVRCGQHMFKCQRSGLRGLTHLCPWSDEPMCVL